MQENTHQVQFAFLLIESHVFADDVITDNLCTQGYHVIDDFLEEKHYRQLQTIAQTLHQQGSFQSAKIGLQIQAQHNKTIRSDDICWLDTLAEHESITCYLQTINAFAQNLNQALFLSLSDFETHFAVYQPGAFYKKHVDQFHLTSNRKISCVYYLNEDWQPSYGGSLKLYNQQDEFIQEVMPIGNRFICFNSELPHEVCPTQKTRYSITGWMKTRADILLQI